MILVCFYLQLYILFFFLFFFLGGGGGVVLYLFSNFITVLGLVKFYPLSVAESSLCINDCATCPSQFSDPAKVYDLVSPSALFDSPHSVCKQTLFEDIYENDPCCQCNQYSV